MKDKTLQYIKSSPPNSQIEKILHKITKPTYVLEISKLRYNLEILDYVQKNTGAKILLALKGFAFWSSFDLVSKYLSGITASGIYEARLGFEEFKKYNKDSQIAVFSPAFSKKEILELLPISNHIIFNSINQLEMFYPLLNGYDIDIGLRVNPLYSEVSPAIYNPCIDGSRLGMIPSEFKKGLHLLSKVSGIHFHTHCEQNSDALQRTLIHFKKHFGEYIKDMKWVNFGGGHHITRNDYDIDLLIKIINDFRDEFGGIDVYLEPGEAVGWQTGSLVGEVRDIITNKYKIAITNLSAAAHMPDCLEMPYIPQIRGAKIINLESIDNDFSYRLGAPSCLAGDVIGDYEFDKELKIGDKIIIEDMIHYTIVKNNTFNGIPLPDLAILKENGDFEIVREFGYDDYKYRNG
ncbi:carboxynorspermidine decarboxylase [Helicobacter sp. MIT 99-5507]|uniref:carboxynorspermidine decarboxylase n=1 Tax=Helicobacter sp. MIT 99-5507 TaxID=152489 RepID=UPI000E1EF639|nr:carboxynorspermidine decarboxylase [Helicobacter sp. MIT 99-5507]RDU58660.1 carboxynorspermidine decarboxylase [Helicobacter sp. MIT 99-5507]